MERVLITGASGGIGRTLAEGFARAGYFVIATDLNPAEFHSKQIVFLQADLQNEREISTLYEKIRKMYGPIHILINNAAISKFQKPVWEISAEEFDRVIHTNLRGSFLCAKYFIAANQGESYGRIINFASTRWHQNEAHWEAYGASKGGIVSLTNSLCVSLMDTPITVNAISPGWIETGDYDALTEADHRQHPSGRVGKPEDVLRVCLFLAAKESDFINGANILVDGGMTKRMFYVE
ncbi:SDR family oxidoreductase [Anaerotignum lactatifermentans]|uniref:SDR family oxidoreductase n=1 Tax=Anaerotignum lactatifermentans TaxID=160404 RepID=A0ABS2G9U6_9FIRM|nr:SDR family oxidoreductase [Anaerotignum lactatifermentans]MBM6828518.1 SDR family oxidoreductase [Anaerotignum lactatifermentans]MBM6877925.1 SDR family oxidoreductase [Anaerotignum lactatifermentans]MBM6950100.1 SDR family oxidoreductase [Anaerotignum lactatifermentans]